jgi:hypothetical protein
VNAAHLWSIQMAGNDVLFMMGSDFHYANAHAWFINLDRCDPRGAAPRLLLWAWLFLCLSYPPLSPPEVYIEEGTQCEPMAVTNVWMCRWQRCCL